MEIVTHDIVLAATLKLKGFKMTQMRPDLLSNGKRGEFVFPHVDQRVVDDYHLGSLEVEPIAFNQAIRSLSASIKRIL